MRGLFVVLHPNGDMTAEDINEVPDYKRLQEAVGGFIEIVPYWEGVMYNVNTKETLKSVAFCNEEGKLHGLEFNAGATLLWEQGLPADVILNDVLVGPIVIVAGDDELLREL